MKLSFVVWCILLGLSASGFAALPLPIDPPIKIDPPIVPVPEAGSTLLLLTLAMAGVEGVRRWASKGSGK